jgi:hypothetical protein
MPVHSLLSTANTEHLLRDHLENDANTDLGDRGDDTSLCNSASQCSTHVSDMRPAGLSPYQHASAKQHPETLLMAPEPQLSSCKNASSLATDIAEPFVACQERIWTGSSKTMGLVAGLFLLGK